MSVELPLVEPLERALQLRSMDMFRTLGAEEIATLAQIMRERFVRAGTVLDREGRIPESLYLIVDGRIRVERQGRVLAVRPAPAGVGLMGLLAGIRTPRVVAETDTVALVADAGTFFEVMEDHFSIFLHVRDLLGRQLRALREELRVDPFRNVGSGAPGATEGNSLTSADRLLWLRRNPVFESVGISVLAGLVREEKEERFPEGAVLFERDEPARCFYFVVEGSVVVSAERPDGFARAGVGVTIGVDAALAGVSHLYRAVAETRVTAMRIEADVLLDVMEDHPDFASRVLRFYAREYLRLEAERAESEPSSVIGAPS